MYAKFKNIEILDFEHLLEYIGEYNFTKYYGHNDDDLKGYLFSDETDVEIIIIFKNLNECKEIEFKLQEYCEITGKKFKKKSQKTTINITKTLKRQINEFKQDGETNEDVLWRLMFLHYKSL